MNWLGRLTYHVVKFISPFVPYWQHDRVRIVLLNDHNEALLVKTWLSRQFWSLPGGGIERGERPIESAIRETQEETGILLEAQSLQKLADETEPEMGFRYAVYVAHVTGRPLPRLSLWRRREIIARKWWPINRLPTPMPAYTHTGIALARDKKS